ncbi:MAG: helix-turn-helix domain-containing protein [Bacteroidales bacterium]|nr:helix-turn-helix domain-containing protein [Bacteroidales bacterium]
MSTNRKQELLKIQNEVLTVFETAEIIGVHKNTLLNYRKRGLLVPFKAGGRVLYRLEDVRNFLTGK